MTEATTGSSAGSVETTQVVRVRIAGSGSTVKVVLQGDDTVGDVLRGALILLDLPVDTADKLSPVVNGQDAVPTDKVVGGDVVAAAPRVVNG